MAKCNQLTPLPFKGFKRCESFCRLAVIAWLVSLTHCTKFTVIVNALLKGAFFAESRHYSVVCATTPVSWVQRRLLALYNNNDDDEYSPLQYIICVSCCPCLFDNSEASCWWAYSSAAKTQL